ncbi:MAG: tRNA (adenosine(37)-N6)-dimethylallyltransferase MiaA [Endomicrobia bacterium]|nr:tRNA (adenosine(37)-N6)-dimethylallyltransferase MiaA [Endomicrobiia bacterium]
MKKIIVISGPTASGKTKKAVELCKKENGEIISCDSRQVYKYLDIGTNKNGNYELLITNYESKAKHSRVIEGINQYLTDIITPDRTYSAADFVKDADDIIEEIINNEKVPVIAGGTGLYIKALLYGLDEMPPADESLRKELKTKTAEEQYEQLLKLDPESAQKNKKNPQRLLRALEVNLLSGKTMAEHFKPKSPRYDFTHYSLSVENKILYERINSRCKDMINRGMIEETQKVLDMGYAKNCPGLSGIGYRHIVQYLNNEISKETMLEEFCKDTRHYAKRQNTWFKSQPDITAITNY